MEFDLIDRWWHLCCLHDPFEVLWQVVADADGFGETLRLQIFHLLPLLLVFLLLVAEEWRVNEVPAPASQQEDQDCKSAWKDFDVQIDIVQLQLFQARRQCIWNIRDVGNDFRGHEEFLSCHAALLEGSSELSLCLVDFCAILVVIVETERCFCGVNTCLVELGFVTRLVPGSAGAIANLRDISHAHEYANESITIGMEFPSLSLRFGIGV